MRRAQRNQATATAIRPAVRCAIYTRKSTDEGLDKDFSTLDAQREAAESYIDSQRNEGWLATAERYDDGGYSGGNLERPALKRLLTDTEAGLIDAVVVYKYDRLSRSMLDFLQMLDFFERHEVSFVSVSQRFDTSTPIGRMTLQILMSFGEFERQIIAERTRDKIRAARRKGKWTGGHPPLGFDLALEGGKLVVNKDEARAVRAIFALYADSPSLIEISQELNRRGLRRKSWKTRNGKTCGGGTWNRVNLGRLLKDLGLSDSLLVGLAQAVALIPGVSRSGITITAALVRNFRRDSAARFSFLLATPVPFPYFIRSLNINISSVSRCFTLHSLLPKISRTTNFTSSP